MAVQKTVGIVLRREDVRETSVLLTVYTQDYGKLRLLSKGVRTPEQRFVSAYELFALNEIVFYERKRKNSFLLSQCELLDFFFEIRKSLERTSYAAYLVELLELITPIGEKNTLLYELLKDSLVLLRDKASPKRVARIFEIKLLAILGFMPRLQACVGCNRKLDNQREKFSISLGGVLCDGCVRNDKNARPILKGTVNFISHIETMPFDKIRHVKVSKRVGNELERLLKDFIKYHLDVRPKSLDFIQQIAV